MTQSQTKLSRFDYHVAWIAPGPEVALDPARLMLDQEHDTPDLYHQFDYNTYLFGSMNGHNVVIATTPPGLRMNANAGRLAAPMFNTFPNIKMVLLVGIGGGVPKDPPDTDTLQNIHLGDVVVGCTVDGKPAVVDYNSGISGVDGLELHGTINRADWILLQPLGYLQSNYRFQKTNFAVHINKLLRFNQGAYDHPGLQHDKLFRGDYHGPHTARDNKDCENCDPRQIIQRNSRSEEHAKHLVFHMGRIGTANTVIANGKQRDEISNKLNGIQCFEGSAAGVDASRQCLVIRGISDYCDAHKNGLFKHYAAGRAAVFARELLGMITPIAVERLTTSPEGQQPHIERPEMVTRGRSLPAPMATDTAGQPERSATVTADEPPCPPPAYRAQDTQSMNSVRERNIPQGHIADPKEEPRASYKSSSSALRELGSFSDKSPGPSGGSDSSGLVKEFIITYRLSPRTLREKLSIIFPGFDSTILEQVSMQPMLTSVAMAWKSRVFAAHFI